VGGHEISSKGAHEIAGLVDEDDVSEINTNWGAD